MFSQLVELWELWDQSQIVDLAERIWMVSFRAREPSWRLAGDKTRYRSSLTRFRASTITSVCFLVNTTGGKELLKLA